MLKRNLLIIFWVAVIALLFLFSMVFTDTDKAIVAQVEPMKMAVSYHKAVKVLEIYVFPGQKVEPGDILVKVERPDLVMDLDRKNNELERLLIDKGIAEQEYTEKQKSSELKKNQELEKLKTEIDQLTIIVENNQKLSNQFGSLTGYADTISNYGKSYYQIELHALEKRIDFVNAQYKRETASSASLFQQEMKSILIKENELHEEIQNLEGEENELIRKAEMRGTIGSVNAQEGELLSPYTTILSIYELNPTVIKAVMNEGYKYEAEVGQEVTVESTNRQYKIEGKIFEIGSRIIEYPSRLKSNKVIPMYGQELFIRIPKENNFLNGERVFVMIKK